MINIRQLESELWESADLLRAGSKLTSNQYCMPVLGLIFLRYAYSRFKLVEAEILKDRPVRNGRVLPVEASDFLSRSALFLPREAQYAYLVDLPENIPAAGLTNRNGQVMNSLGEVVNNAMELVEEQSEQLSGVLPKDYTMFSDELLAAYAKRRRAHVVVKGLRAVSDFEQEVQMAVINRKLNPRLETMFLASSEKYTYLSSTIVKEMARYGANLGDFLPREIVEDVNRRMKELQEGKV